MDGTRKCLNIVLKKIYMGIKLSFNMIINTSLFFQIFDWCLYVTILQDSYPFNNNNLCLYLMQSIYNATKCIIKYFILSTSHFKV